MPLDPTYRPGLIWQYEDPDNAGTWINFGYAHDLGTLVRTRRFGPGPRQEVTAQKFRLIKINGPDYEDARMRLDAVRFWRETDQLSPVRVFGFSFNDTDQTYMVARTDRNLEVYRDDVRMASIPQPHGVDEVTLTTRCAVLDTLLQFHADVATQRVTRQGQHDQWDARDLEYETLPVFDYTGEREGGVNEVQQISFRDYVAGDTFNITVEGETTNSIVYGGVDDSAAIQAALEALPNIDAGGCVVTMAAADKYEVEYVGENRCQDIGELAPKTLVSDAGLVIGATLTQGVEGGEPIISATRGWPACGAFYQQRLWIGGLKSRPQTILGSRLGDWFKFKSHGGSLAIAGDLDSDENGLIRAFFPGQALQIFTSSSERFISKEPIVAPPENKRASGKGVEAGVPLAADSSDTTMFVCAGGRALAECVWDDQRQKFVSEYVSKFATHLFAGTPDARKKIVDMGFRKAADPDASDRAILIRDDGAAVVMNALRQDAVTGFVRWSTDGLFLAAGANQARVEYVAVQRVMAGALTENVLERVDDLALLDCMGADYVPSDAEVAAGGVFEVDLPHLDGREVDLFVDGFDRGVVEVVDGKVSFEQPALRKVCAGLHFEPMIVTLPVVLEQDPRSGVEAQPRMAKIDLNVFNTAGRLKAGLQDGRLFDVRMDKPPIADVGTQLNPFTGWAEMEAVPGFRTGGRVVILQDRPGPFELKEIVLTVDT